MRALMQSPADLLLRARISNFKLPENVFLKMKIRIISEILMIF